MLSLDDNAQDDVLRYVRVYDMFRGMKILWRIDRNGAAHISAEMFKQSATVATKENKCWRALIALYQVLNYLFDFSSRRPV